MIAKKKLILGMAKSSKNLSGAKRQKLELDFLRMVYAREILNNFYDVEIVLAVSSESIRNTIEKIWCEKYQVKGKVKVCVFSGRPDIEYLLEREKEGNKCAIVKQGDKRAIARHGQEKYEKFLKDCINKDLSDDAIQYYEKILKQIQWDYIELRDE